MPFNNRDQQQYSNQSPSFDNNFQQNKSSKNQGQYNNQQQQRHNKQFNNQQDNNNPHFDRHQQRQQSQGFDQDRQFSMSPIMDNNNMYATPILVPAMIPPGEQPLLVYNSFPNEVAPFQDNFNPMQMPYDNRFQQGPSGRGPPFHPRYLSMFFSPIFLFFLIFFFSVHFSLIQLLFIITLLLHFIISSFILYIF